MSESDVKVTGTDQTAGGTSQDATTAGNGGPIQLTSEQLNERLARKERTAREALLKELGFEKADDLKALVQAAREREQAEMGELERIKAENARLAEQAQQVEQRARLTALRAEFKAQAALKGAAHPDDALALAGDVAQYLAEDGQPQGVTEAVDRLISSGRLPLARGAAPDLDAGAGSGTAASKKVTLTETELHMARRMGLTPEQYAKYK